MAENVDPGKYWWTGAESSRLVKATAWIGETPEGDELFFLLYPDAMDAAAKMRQLAETLDLSGGMRPQFSDGASVLITTRRTFTLRLLGHEVSTVPAPATHRAVAAEKGLATLAVGFDRWDGRSSTLDAYLARDHFRRIRFGRIRVDQEPRP